MEHRPKFAPPDLLARKRSVERIACRDARGPALLVESPWDFAADTGAQSAQVCSKQHNK